MRKYLFQRFLPDCDTDDINLDSLTYVGENAVQRVSVSELDEKIDTEESLISFLSRFSNDDTIVLTYDRPNYNNPILCDYALKTFKSYLYRMRRLGYKCYWERSKVA